MTYETFIKTLQTELGFSVPTYVERDPKARVDWNTAYNERYWFTDSGLKLYDKAPALINSWETGGVSGGSCWESSNPQPYSSGKTEPEWTDLNQILEHFAPEISFLKYKMLMGVTKVDTRTQSEYYGNCTDYNVRILPLKTIYEFLCEKGIL